VLISILLIFAACILVGGGRIMVRRARKPRNRFRSILGWTLMLLGLILMILGVLHW
jgi:hypothetical protein